MVWHADQAWKLDIDAGTEYKLVTTLNRNSIFEEWHMSPVAHAQYNYDIDAEAILCVAKSIQKQQHLAN